MSIRSLRTLIAIADEGSFAAAANAIGMTQSAISMQVKALEADLGAVLFDRTKRPPVLNEAGHLLVSEGREIVRRYEAARRRFGTAGLTQVRGRMRLGVVGSVQTGLLPLLLNSVRRHYPELQIILNSGFSDELIALVERGGLDAAIVSDYDRKSEVLRWQPFVRERLVLIAPPDAPVDDPRRLVELYPFIRYRPSAAVGRVINSALKASKLPVQESMQLDWLEAIEAMVHHGLGVSVVPDRRVGPQIRMAVKRVAFGATPFYRVLGLIDRPGKTGRQLCDLFFRQVSMLVDDPRPQ